MKYSSLVLTIVVATFGISCQDNSDLLSPSQTSRVEAKRGAEIAKHLCYQLPLGGFLRVPGQYNEFVELSGFVEYSITILPRDPIPPNPQFTFLLDMIVNANLRPWGSNGPVWYFSGAAQNEVEPIDDKNGFLTTRYWVAEMRMWFVLTLRLTETSVEVSQMRLELPRVKIDTQRDAD